MVDCEVYNLANLVLINAALNSGNDRDVQSNFCQTVESAQLFFNDVRLTTQNAIGVCIKAIQLEVDGRTYFVQLVQQAVISCDALAVRVNHHKGNIASLGRANEV